MLRTIVSTLSLALVCLASWAEAPKSAPILNETRFNAYENCVVGGAKSFAGSPDSTELIVKRAMGACTTEKRALSETLRAGGLDSGELEEVLRKLDRQVFDAASRAVLEERESH